MSVYNILYCNESDHTNDQYDYDPTLEIEKKHSLDHQFNLTKSEINNRFLAQYNLEYISDYVEAKKIPFRILSHPKNTNTCYDKARLLGDWDPLNVIKALYLECPNQNVLYAIVIPETGCFVDRKYISNLLDLQNGVLLAKAKNLPLNMSYGTCSPFISQEDLIENGGKVAKILFDSETLIAKKNDKLLDDFSYGMDHRFSLQMNYYHCYKLLKAKFKNVLQAEELLTLNFTERFIRRNGKIKLNYDFKSLNYRTAKFINNIHGIGDVSVENDYVDELDLPDVLTIN
jgi:hypothetical protein